MQNCLCPIELFRNVCHRQRVKDRAKLGQATAYKYSCQYQLVLAGFLNRGRTRVLLFWKMEICYDGCCVGA